MRIFQEVSKEAIFQSDPLMQGTHSIEEVFLGELRGLGISDVGGLCCLSSGSLASGSWGCSCSGSDM